MFVYYNFHCRAWPHSMTMEYVMLMTSLFSNTEMVSICSFFLHYVVPFSVHDNNDITIHNTRF